MRVVYFAKFSDEGENKMRAQKRTHKEDREESGAFSVIPMEKLSGLDETLWLEQMLVEFTQSVRKRTSKKLDESHNG